MNLSFVYFDTNVESQKLVKVISIILEELTNLSLEIKQTVGDGDIENMITLLEKIVAKLDELVDKVNT